MHFLNQLLSSQIMISWLQLFIAWACWADRCWHFCFKGGLLLGNLRRDVSRKILKYSRLFLLLFHRLCFDIIFLLNKLVESELAMLIVSQGSSLSWRDGRVFLWRFNFDCDTRITQLNRRCLATLPSLPIIMVEQLVELWLVFGSFNAGFCSDTFKHSILTLGGCHCC